MAGRQLRWTLGTVDKNGGDWLLSASRSTTRGDDLYYLRYAQQNLGSAQGLDYDRSTLVAKVRREGVASPCRERVSLPTAAFSQVFNDPRSRVTDPARASLQEYAGLWSQPTTTARLRRPVPAMWATGRTSPPVTANRDLGRGRWVGSELQWVSTYSQYKVSWGVDYRRDLDITQRNMDLAPEAQYLDKSSSGDVMGIYLQDEVALRSDLVLHARLRWNNLGQQRWPPRLGLVYLVGLPRPSNCCMARPTGPRTERDRVETPGGVVELTGLRSRRVHLPRSWCWSTPPQGAAGTGHGVQVARVAPAGHQRCAEAGQLLFSGDAHSAACGWRRNRGAWGPMPGFAWPTAGSGRAMPSPAKHWPIRPGTC